MIIKESEETFGGDGYVYGIDCGDGFIGICLYPKPSGCTTLNTCSFLYFIHASIKWFIEKEVLAGTSKPFQVL